MDSILTFAKENFQLLCLLIGILGVLVGCISVIYELKKRNRKKQSKNESMEERE